MNYCCLLLFLLVSLFGKDVSSLGLEIHKIPLRFTKNYLYYASLDFGSQRQVMEVQLDTGSRTMAVFCDICQKGCVLEQEFKTSKSRTFKSITCGTAKAIQQYLSLNSEGLQECLQDCQGEKDDYQCVGDLIYGSGALQSYLDYDLAFQIMGVRGTETRVPSTFGCIYDQKNFKEGIWGVSISPSNQFLDSIYEADKKQGLNPKKVFTICTNGTDSVLNIGGIDSTYHIGEGITVRVSKDQHSWWKVNQQDIGKFIIKGQVVRDPEVPLGKRGLIIDSGTDTIVLPTAVETAIREKIDSMCDESELCQKGGEFEIFERTYNITDAPNFFSSLPPLEIELGGKLLETPISNYFWKLNDNQWALGIMQAQKFHFPISILGSTWMNNFDIAFDREDSTIIIYDISRCSASGRLLQIDEDDTNDPYELPETRGTINTYNSIEKLKKKHQKIFEKTQG